MTSRASIDDLAAVLSLATAAWLEDAHCGPGDELVDITEDQADDLARALCYRCPVIGPCRDLGESLAPHRHGSLYGARYWAPRERP